MHVAGRSAYQAVLLYAAEHLQHRRSTSAGAAAAGLSSLVRGTAGCAPPWLKLPAADAPPLGGAAGMRPAALSAEALSPRTDLLRRTVPGRLRPWRSLCRGGARGEGGVLGTATAMEGRGC